MPLTDFSCASTKVSDLSPMRGAPLVRLGLHRTRITDLSPLKEFPLREVLCDFDPKRDTEILHSIKTLEKINGLPVAEFWKQVEQGKTPQPTGGSPKPVTIDDAFIKQVAAVPAEQQVARVVAKLKELNPGYDGKEESVRVRHGARGDGGG